MYLNYNVDQIHQLLNEYKKLIVSYKKRPEGAWDLGSSTYANYFFSLTN
jgi:hypothetical protein